jgi:hypothetical protein
MNKPLNLFLYNQVKEEASKKFKSKTGVYRSSWIVKQYKKLGGKYSGVKSPKTGLKRWYQEKWIDLNRPKKSGGYEQCGRSRNQMNKSKYPLCRPSIKKSSKTPRLYQTFDKKKIHKLKSQKKLNVRVKWT